MTIIASMGAAALLFIIFGLLAGQRECRHDGGCAGCGATCHRRPAAREDIA